MIRLRIKEIAEEKGISIAKLARKADLDYKTVYRIANNPYAEISTFTLGRLAEALEVSVKELVEDAPNVEGEQDF
ncbi:MAG: helix-turn-helix domain-containing protein [Ktedonobacteraceae bacterium]|jgi:DNA-binding Xre family transcriptional regulator